MDIISYDDKLLVLYSNLFKIQACKKMNSLIDIYVYPIRRLVIKAKSLANSSDYDIYCETYYEEILKHISNIKEIIISNYYKEKENKFPTFEGWDLPDDLFSFITVRKNFIDIMELLERSIEDFYISDGVLKYSKDYILFLLNRCNDVFKDFEDILKKIIDFKLKYENTLDRFIDEKNNNERKM